MTIDFHDPNNRRLYTSRDAHEEWGLLISRHVPIRGRTVLDVGCGGGIYSKVMADLGAETVIAMDFSEEMLRGARENCTGYGQIRFVRGNALDTGLGDSSVDVVLQRALIHHLTDLETCFREAARVLRPNGVLIVQDRTPEDCLLPGSPTHLRGYFFEKFPRLIKREVSRRHSGEKVVSALQTAGLQPVGDCSFWERRKVHAGISELAEDLKGRTGRSILFELSDTELAELIAHIVSKLEPSEPIVEEDRWTIWFARKS